MAPEYWMRNRRAMLSNHRLNMRRVGMLSHAEADFREQRRLGGGKTQPALAPFRQWRWQLRTGSTGVTPTAGL